MGKEIEINPLEPVAAPKKRKGAPVVIADELVGDSGAANFPALGNVDAEIKCDNVVTFEITDEVQSLAQRFGLNLHDSHEVRIERAAQNMNRSVQYLLAAGIDLLALRADCEHGVFSELLEERGFERRSAYRAIQYAQFLLSQPEPEREKLLSYPKSHVLALASADPEVVEDLLDDDDIDLKALSVRELRQTIKELDRKKTDLAVQVETLELEKKQQDDIIKTLREDRVKTGGDVPFEVQDIRLEMAALHKKAELAIQDLGLIHDKLLEGAINDLPAEWRLSVEKHMTASVASLHIMTSNLLSTMSPDLHIAEGEPCTFDIFSPSEALRCAQEYKTLIEEHRHEKTLREWDREQARPRGPGRPKNRPE